MSDSVAVTRRVAFGQPGRAGTRRFVLASASPARRRLLEAAGIRVQALASGVDERTVSGDDIPALTRAIAGAKADAVAGRVHDALVLGCDSLLEVDGRPYGKPAGQREARALWQRLAGGNGVLHTGQCLLDVHEGYVRKRIGDGSATTVHFGQPTEAEVAAYVASGEPVEVAGGFTIDGLGGWFVERIDGDHGTVLGLSLPLLRRMLAQLGVSPADLWAT